jgi:hypothetical protein
MFQPQEVDAIRHAAQALTGDAPSRAILERLAQVANEPCWTVEAVCLEIDVLAAAGKLAKADSEADPAHNQARADTLKTLMHLLGDADQTSRGQMRGRRRRAYALHTINKLRRA